MKGHTRSLDNGSYNPLSPGSEGFDLKRLPRRVFKLEEAKTLSGLGIAEAEHGHTLKSRASNPKDEGPSVRWPSWKAWCAFPSFLSGFLHSHTACGLEIQVYKGT